jgi:integrase
LELPSPSGDRRRVRRGGFASKSAAVAALAALTGAAPGPVQGLRVGEWLERWLASRVSLRASTSRGYAAHVRGYLIPYLGGIPLAELSAADVQGMFTAIIRGDAALRRPVSAATLHRIHATLRAALNAAVRAGLIAVNPGRWPELPAAARPRPLVWTPARVELWQREGWRPVVGVWTAAQTAQFLSYVRTHRLYALFHLVALRGLRRGEAAGLRWADLDLDGGTLTVSGQLQQLGGHLVAGAPKSEAGRRVVALDWTTIAALRGHRVRQQTERAGAGWVETGYVFTTPLGKPVGPDRLTRLFRRLVAESGLPPVTLHGLRHGPQRRHRTQPGRRSCHRPADPSPRQTPTRRRQHPSEQCPTAGDRHPRCITPEPLPGVTAALPPYPNELRTWKPPTRRGQPGLHHARKPAQRGRTLGLEKRS